MSGSLFCFAPAKLLMWVCWPLWMDPTPGGPSGWGGAGSPPLPSLAGAGAPAPGQRHPAGFLPIPPRPPSRAPVPTLHPKALCPHPGLNCLQETWSLEQRVTVHGVTWD